MIKSPGYLALLLALLCNTLFADPVAALSLEYLYRGNHFDQFEGVTGLFSPTDQVTARFTVDCAVAHSEGTCRSLPYDDYFLTGAIDPASMNFSAGPVALPTADGRVEVRRFSFSTDYMGRIVDWDMDLFLNELQLNVDTDNANGGTDSAAAPGEAANVQGQPGVWGNDLSDTETNFDLAVKKTVNNPTPDTPQEALEFTVSIVNRGPGIARDVTVVDQLPPQLAIPEGMAAYTSIGYFDADSGRWEVGDLDNSLPQVMTIPVLITADPQPACIINAASTDTAGDSYPGDNDSAVAVRSPATPGCADLVIEELFLYQYDTQCKTDFPVAFQVRVRNAGPDVAMDVVLTIQEPLFQAPGLTISNADCDGLRCTWPVLQVGQSVTASGGSEHISINGISEDFNVDDPEPWELRAEISSAGSQDYQPENNVYTQRMQIDPHQRDPACDTPSTGPDWDLSGVGGGGGCFIATAGYGSSWHPSVQALRAFRDKVLMQSAWGREVVDFYYRHSPAVARYISNHDSMRTLTRWLLTPVVFAITYPYSALLGLISMGVLLYAGFTRARERAT